MFSSENFIISRPHASTKLCPPRLGFEPNVYVLQVFVMYSKGSAQYLKLSRTNVIYILYIYTFSYITLRPQPVSSSSHCGLLN